MPDPDKFIEMGRVELDPAVHAASAPAEAWGIFAHYDGISRMAHTELVGVREDRREADVFANEYDQQHGHMTLEVEGDPESHVWSECRVTVGRVARTALRAAIVIEAAYEPVMPEAAQPE